MMRPKRFATFLPGFAMLLGIVAGCATLPEYRPQPPAVSDAGPVLLDAWLARRSQHHTLQGVARVRVQTPERTVNGTQVLLAEEPVRLRAETLSPFGTPLLVMTANDTEMAVLVPGDNTFYRGRATPENFERFTRLPLRPADLVGILLYRPPLLAYRSLESAPLADGGWQLVLIAGERRQQLRFDADRRLTEAKYLYGEELQLHVVYGDFAADAAALPRRIDLDLPQHQLRAGLVFSELAANRPLQAEVFTQLPPPGAKVTVLDEVAAAPPSPQAECK